MSSLKLVKNQNAQKPAPKPTHYSLHHETRLAWSSLMADMQAVDRILRGPSVPIAKRKELQYKLKMTIRDLTALAAVL